MRSHVGLQDNCQDLICFINLFQWQKVSICSSCVSFPHAKTFWTVIPKDHRPVVISGPSGVGKGTLIEKLRAAHPATFATTVSHTTRHPRAGEQEGKDYFFVSEETFSTLISQDVFIEWAVYSGNHYGTSKGTVVQQTAKGRLVILDIDMQGAKLVKADPTLQARYVFIKPPSLEVLEHRLRQRSTENEANIQKRLAQAKAELDEVDRNDLYDITIVNDNLEAATQSLTKFIFGESIDHT